jgi:glycosyltransferase involved in cell wall biosynthesis
VWKIVAKFTLKRADRVACNSEVVKKELILLGAMPDKILKIYQGINTSQFSPRQADEALKNKLRISGLPTVICIRHLRPLYNVEMLVNAIPLVLKHTPQVRFVIAGDGVQRSYLENLAASLGASQNINFVGYVLHDELPGYLASADIYVSTSLSDSASLSLQEAMACELVPVVTDLPGNREWINDGENGFIVPQNDHQALAEKIIYLIDNSEIRAKFGKMNRKMIEERAEYDKEMGKVEKLYEGLVADAKSS